MASNISSSGCSNTYSGVANSEPHPNTEQKTEYAMMDEINAGTSDSNSESLLYNTLIAKRAPPSGARKMLPMPPAAPQRSIIRLDLSSSFSLSARYDPKPAPICAIGPSLPALPPVPMVIADANALMTGECLDDRHTFSYDSLLLMVRIDHGIGSVPFRFGSAPIDEDACDKPADCWQQHQNPRMRIT
jgi:hypothetical protein